MARKAQANRYEVVYFHFGDTGCTGQCFTAYKEAVALYKELKEEKDVAHIQVNNRATGKTLLEYMSKEYYFC